ncbi:MAG: hypothetical protein HYV47_00310 [Candidatus Nealsonbacteria bacterium]|nr:hypothetical protein [Candidatus Nealsonbacteria bacterium]
MIVKLPVPISSIIDQAVDIFVSSHSGVETDKRYQGADLWMIRKHETGNSDEPSIVSRRITIAAYPENEDELVFIPDIIVTKANSGRYVPTAEKRRENMRRLSIFDIEGRLFRKRNENQRRKELEKIRNEMVKILNSAWVATNNLSTADATELVP